MGENNWDLQAVVRSCTGSTVTPHGRDPFSSFFSSPVVGDIDVDTNDEIFIPDLSSTRSPVVQELEELCKPFFRSPSMPSSRPPETNKQQQQQQQLQRSFSEPARTKKRKKQQKKVVCQVPVDSLSNDVWAWRKYGQKPIKGSPYPRGYYRCSSSKGCPARKQVERSRADPGVLIITYTAEHNHPIPTHRNSLAGSTRQKLSTTSQKVNSAVGVKMKKVNAAASSSSPPVLSPPPPEAEEEDDEEDGMLLGTDMGMLGEDDMLFAALGEPDQPPPSTAAASIAAELTDQFSSTFSSSQWMAGTTASGI